MAKLALWPYPHLKRTPKPVMPATKEDVAKLIRKMEIMAKIGLLSTRTRRKLVQQLRKEGKL